MTVAVYLASVAMPAPFTYPRLDAPMSFKRLDAAEADATRVGQLITHAVGDTADLRLEHAKEPNRSDVLGSLARIGGELNDGDLLVFGMFGHGCQVPDLDGDDKPGDDGAQQQNLDEAIVVADGPIIDDDLQYAWEQLPSGVRVFTIVDTCHAESSTMDITFAEREPRIEVSAPAGDRVRIELAAATSATEGYEKDGAGVLSSALVAAWGLPGARTSYRSWFSAADALVNAAVSRQVPVLTCWGPDPAAIDRAPFT